MTSKVNLVTCTAGLFGSICFFFMTSLSPASHMLLTCPDLCSTQTDTQNLHFSGSKLAARER